MLCPQKRQEVQLLHQDPASLTRPQLLARDLRKAELHVLELWQNQTATMLSSMAGAPPRSPCPDLLQCTCSCWAGVQGCLASTCRGPWHSWQG